MSRLYRLKWFGCVILGLAPALGLGAEAPRPAAPRLSATQIIERNVAARGGLSAWHAVQSMSWSGKLDAGGGNEPRLKIPGQPAPAPLAQTPAAQPQLPFVLHMKRMRKQRLELEFNGQTALQIYDGAQGWKVRPFLNRHEVETFTKEELDGAANQADLDGFLIDSAAKGTKVELVNVERVEGSEAYKLKLTLKNNHVLHVWVDAHSFLEVKIEGAPRRLDGRYHQVDVFLRDYRSVGGLKIPHLLETRVQGVPRSEKIQVEKVTVNAPLAEALFARPI
jgi:hypothetical protein